MPGVGEQEEQGVLDQLVEWVRSRYFGKYRGTVTDNDDPTNRGRIKVRVPAVLGDLTVWAMPCVPYAGEQIGQYMIPAVESGVFVEFEGGDASFPIWTGCFWSDGQLPANEGGTTVTPPLKIIRTEQGLMVSMDDNGQTISVSDENGNNLLKIEVQKGQINLKSANKAVVEAPKIELVENSSHPVVFGDELLRYLQQLEQVFITHLHPGQMAAGIIPVVPTPPVPPIPPATPALHSTRVTTG